MEPGREQEVLDVLNDPPPRAWVVHREVKGGNYGKRMDLATRLEAVTRWKGLFQESPSSLDGPYNGSRMGDLTGGDSAVICRNAWVPSHQVTRPRTDACLRPGN